MTLLGRWQQFQLPSPTPNVLYIRMSHDQWEKIQEFDSPHPQQGIPEPIFCANYIWRLKWLAFRRTSALRLDQHIHGVRAAIPKIEADAAVGKLRDRGGDGTGRQIPAGGEDDRVARAAQTAIENQFVPFQPVAGRGSVSLGDAQTKGLALFYRGERNHNDLRFRFDRFVRIDFCGGELRASHQPSGQ